MSDEHDETTPQPPDAGPPVAQIDQAATLVDPPPQKPGPWAPVPGQDDPEPPPEAPTPKILAQDARERARAKRVAAAIERQNARRARVAAQREMLSDDGARITGGETLEDCTSNMELAPKLLAPILDIPDEEDAPWVPEEEEAQLKALPNFTKNGESERRDVGGARGRGLSPANSYDNTEIEDFLHHYAKTGNFNQAAYAIGRSGTAVRKFEKENPIFSQLVAEAMQVYRERIAYEIHVRAVDGIVKPVFGKEGQVGWVREYSDRLLELQARAVYPERYAERTQAALPADMKFGVLIVPGVMASPEEWEAIHGQAARGLPEPIEPSNPGPAMAKAEPVPTAKITRPLGSGGRGTPRR